jgi:hypothetical protein
MANATLGPKRASVHGMRSVEANDPQLMIQ